MARGKKHAKKSSKLKNKEPIKGRKLNNPEAEKVKGGLGGFGDLPG